MYFRWIYIINRKQLVCDWWCLYAIEVINRGITIYGDNNTIYRDNMAIYGDNITIYEDSMKAEQ